MRGMWNNRNNYLMDTYGKKWDGAGKGARKNVLRQGKQNCFMEDVTEGYQGRKLIQVNEKECK